MTFFRIASLHRRLVPGLVLALVLAQGLRLCVPATAEHKVHAVHVESVLTVVADQHETNSAGDVDVPLDLLAKTANAGPAFAALLVFAAVLFLPLPPPGVPRPRAATVACCPPRGHGFLPPPRAPPR